MKRSLASAAADSSASASVVAAVGLEDGVGLIAEPLARIVGEALRRRLLLAEHDPGANLVGIPTGEERHVRLLAGDIDRRTRPAAGQ